MPMVEVVTPQGMEEMEFNLKDMFANLMPKQTKKQRVKIPEALEHPGSGGGGEAASTWRR